MFVNLFDKVFIVDKNNVPEFDPYTQKHASFNYTEVKETYPCLQKMYEDWMDNWVKYGPNNKYTIYNDNMSIHLFEINTEDFTQVIQDYCNYLGLTYIEYLLMCCHSDFCTQYVDNIKDIIDAGKEFPCIPEDVFTYKEKQIKKDFERFPAEYAINCLDKPWAKRKYEYFRAYDIYNKVKELQIKYYKHERKIPDILAYFSGSDQTAKAMIVNPHFKEEVLLFLDDKIDTSPYRLPIQAYVDLEPDLGYNRFLTYKFNWPLARHLKQLGYRIDE